jgi:hypothetical protein
VLGRVQAFCNSAMMRACPSAAPAETVTSVVTLGGSSLGRCRAVLGTLYCFALAVNIRSVVGTFRLRLLLLRCRLNGRRLSSLREERSEQYAASITTDMNRRTEVAPCRVCSETTLGPVVANAFFPVTPAVRTSAGAGLNERNHFANCQHGVRVEVFGILR